jgi:ligand-binding sensor domain-containing protein
MTCLSLCAVSHAQDPAGIWLNTDQGLPSNEVYSLLQDRQGFIWLGTDAGLYRYNGNRFIQYKSSFQNSRALSGLTLSPSGRIYCYSFNGQLFYVQGDSLVHYKSWDSRIAQLQQDPENGVWICAKDGLYHFDEKTDRLIAYEDIDGNGKPDSIPHVSSVYVQNNNVLFLASYGVRLLKEDGIHSLRPEGYTKDFPGQQLLSAGPSDPLLLSMQQNPPMIFSSGRLQFLNEPALDAALKERKITFTRSDAAGKYFIGSYTGLIVYHRPTHKVEVLFPHLPVSDVLIDQQGQWWVSTLSNGILRIPYVRHRVWKLYSRSGTSAPIQKIEQSANEIYFSTADGRLAVLNKQTLQMEVHQAPIQADIQSLYYRSTQKDVLFCINNFLFALKNKGIQTLPGQFIPVKSILPFSNGYLLMSSAGTRFYKDINKSDDFEIIDPYWTREAIMDTVLQHLVLATNKGIAIYALKGGSFDSVQRIIPEKQINSMAMVSTGHYFALSFDGIVYEVKNNRAKIWLELPTHVTAYKMQIHDKELVVASNNGLYISNIDQPEWSTLTKLDGLVSNEIRAFLFDGLHLWIATNQGVQRILYGERLPDFPASVFVKSVQIEEQEFGPDVFLDMHFDQSLLIFPEVLSYRDNQQFVYAYRILPHDSTWFTLPGSIAKIEIPSVPDGAFEIQLRTISPKGTPSKNTVSIRGFVHPPFWQRWWFYVLIFATALGLAFFIFRWRVSYLRRKQADELARVRMENQLLMSQQTALKAQMNPHFIFNVLNSIKGFIYENDKKSATTYLNDFSSLVRNVLDNSSRKNIRLEEEVDLLRRYISLEGMLMQHEFVSELKVDETVDLHDTMIPPMLVQPYIENAFKHGLRHKQGPKKLLVHIGRKEENLVILIEDNGIGRQASAALNEERKGHQSFASDGTQKRMELLQKQYSGDFSVSMEDIVTSHGEVSGTRVVIKLKTQFDHD